MFDMLNSKYFKSLPVDVKEKVWNCGLIFNVENELRKYVSTLEGCILTGFIADVL